MGFLFFGRQGSGFAIAAAAQTLLRNVRTGASVGRSVRPTTHVFGLLRAAATPPRSQRQSCRIHRCIPIKTPILPEKEKRKQPPDGPVT